MSTVKPVSGPSPGAGTAGAMTPRSTTSAGRRILTSRRATTALLVDNRRLLERIRQLQREQAERH